MRLSRHSGHTGIAGAAIAVLLVTMWVPGAAVGATSGAPQTIAEAEAALAAAESSAASASTRALTAAVAAEAARDAANAAAQQSTALREHAETAAADLARERARVGTVVAGLARASTDGPLLARVLTSADPDTLLIRLTLLDRVAGASARTLGSAREAAGVADALRAQAGLAEAEYVRLAALAEADADTARAEAETETAAVTAARAEIDALYARLAALRRTTVATAKADRLAQQTRDHAASGGAGGSIPSGDSPAGTTPISPPAPVAPPAPAAPPAPVAPPAGAPIATPGEAQALARGAVRAYGWGDDQFSCLVSLWNRESGWRVQARNPSSGAYGIPQSWPAEKMAAAGPDWRTSAATQIAWGLSYIKGRHGSPCGAWAHSERLGWY